MEDKQILLNTLVHAADIGFAGRPWLLYHKWVGRVMEEYFRQGDIEKDRNIPVSMFYDRANTSIPSCQVGFIDVLVLPLFVVLGQLVPEVDAVVVARIKENKNIFVNQEKPTEAELERMKLQKKIKTQIDWSWELKNFQMKFNQIWNFKTIQVERVGRQKGQWQDAIVRAAP